VNRRFQTFLISYARSTEDSETLGISFFFSHGKLTRIIVGEVISVE